MSRLIKIIDTTKGVRTTPYPDIETGITWGDFLNLHPQYRDNLAKLAVTFITDGGDGILSEDSALPDDNNLVITLVQEKNKSGN